MRLNTREYRRKYGLPPSDEDLRIDRHRAEVEARRIEDERRRAMKNQQRGVALDFGGGRNEQT